MRVQACEWCWPKECQDAELCVSQVGTLSLTYRVSMAIVICCLCVEYSEQFIQASPHSQQRLSARPSLCMWLPSLEWTDKPLTSLHLTQCWCISTFWNEKEQFVEARVWSVPSPMPFSVCVSPCQPFDGGEWDIWSWCIVGWSLSAANLATLSESLLWAKSACPATQWMFVLIPLLLNAEHYILLNVIYHILMANMIHLKIQ